MDANLHYEVKKQHYHALLREAEHARMVQKLGRTEAVSLRGFVPRFWGKLSARRVSIFGISARLLIILLVAIIFMTVVVLSTLAKNLDKPSLVDPFAALTGVFPGQQADSRLLKAEGFSCWLETLPVMADSSVRCSRELQTGPFSHVTITIWNVIVTRLELVVRERLLSVGDLVKLWGRPHIYQYGSWGHLGWPNSDVMALTVSYKGRYSLFLPVGSVTFAKVGDFEA